MEKKLKVAFICHFSNELVRSHLALHTLRLEKSVRKFFKHPLNDYYDYALWVSDYIEEFEKYDNFEFHIISPHKGMKKVFQDFTVNGIHYHMVKCDYGFIRNTLERFIKSEERTNHIKQRRRINTIISNIDPDLVCLCGAENPYYSASVLDIKDKPIMLLMQTALGNPKLQIQDKEITQYRIKTEDLIFKKVQYVGTSWKLFRDLATKANPNLVFLKNRFPSHIPKIMKVEKTYDFVFFSRTLSKNKGIEDTLKAFCDISMEYPNATLLVIGYATKDYKETLKQIIIKNNDKANVRFVASFDKIDDLHREVQKAKIAVLPGITAPLNSTVRETMHLGMPTIVYETALTPEINKEKRCLIIAELENVASLTLCLKFAIENPSLVDQIGNNGKEYAKIHFSNEKIVKNLTDCFISIVDNYYNKKELRQDLLLKF